MSVTGRAPVEAVLHDTMAAPITPVSYSLNARKSRQERRPVRISELATL